MSFPADPTYKDSGVEWLQKIPEHWDLKRNRVLFEIKKRIAGKLGFDVLSITQRGIRIKDTESNEGQLSQDYSKYQIVEPGQFAMNHMDLLTGFVDLAPFHGVTSPDYRVFGLRSDVICDKRYLLYLLQNGYRRSIFYAFGQGSSHFGRWRLPTQAFNEFRMPVPPQAEQRSISAFLDHETAKIDALVKEQQRLIELLKEKRQALISHAVTKGLDPTAPMKDSGLEWMGTVPTNWRILRAKDVASVFVPHRDKPELNCDGNGLPWITVENMGGSTIESSTWSVSREVVQQSAIRTLQRGAVLASCVGDFGIASITSMECVINQQLQAYLPDGSLNAEFLRYSVQNARCYFEQVATAATIPYVNQQRFAAMPIALPSPDEQAKVVEFLNNHVKHSEELMLEIETVIGLLKERRSALVSAAVTGKIDVRNYTPRDTVPVSDELYAPA